MGKKSEEVFFPKKLYKKPMDTWKRYSTSLVISNMQIKTTVRHHLNLVKKTIIKKTRCEEWEILCTVGRAVNLVSYYEKQYEWPSKN